MTTLSQMVSAEYQPDVRFNENMAAVAPSAAFGRRYLGQSGVTWAYYGGVLNINGTLTTIADGTVALTAGSGGTTNYIELTPTGTVVKNTTGWTAGYIPLYTAVANSTTNSITSWVDYRNFIPVGLGYIAVALTDANTTLTAAQVANKFLHFTGSLTATRTITLPLGMVKDYVVSNYTGQTLTFKGATGSTVDVAPNCRATIYSNGTHILRVTPDLFIGGGAIAMSNASLTITRDAPTVVIA